MMNRKENNGIIPFAMDILKLRHDPNTDPIDVLSLLPDYGEDYDFVLVHVYAHIRNEEIYFEIDKDIYEHIVLYEGKEFYTSVKKYFFTLRMGAILAYPRGRHPFLHLNDFSDPFDDYPTFEKEILHLLEDRKNPPSFVILASEKDCSLYLHDSMKEKLGR